MDVLVDGPLLALPKYLFIPHQTASTGFHDPERLQTAPTGAGYPKKWKTEEACTRLKNY